VDVAAQVASCDGYAGRERLQGDVEVDETFLGAPEEGRHGRRMLRKTMVVSRLSVKPQGLANPHASDPGRQAKSLHPFVLDRIELGSTLHTDDWQGYAGLEAQGYPRQSTAIACSGKTASEVLPGVHRVVSLLKRWLLEPIRVL